MKIAIITDIHGNSAALEAVLKDIDQNEVDHIYCLGDMVAIGPDTNQVLSMLTERTNISYVMGNHEQAVLAASHGTEAPSGHQSERKHHEWIAERLDPKFVNFLEHLPMKLTVQLKGISILMIHYHLGVENQFEEIDKDPNENSLDQRYRNSSYHIVCFGHHHIVHDFRTADRLYFNPGSLGCYDKPLARYGIIELGKERFEHEVHEVGYDNREFLRSYKELKVPDREAILKIFHGNQLDQ